MSGMDRESEFECEFRARRIRVRDTSHTNRFTVTSHERASHRHASRRRVSHRRGPHRHASHECIYLIGMYLIGVYGPVSQGHASHGHASYRRACVGLIGMYNTLFSAQAIPRAA
jgi:hypothetical protein